MNVLSNPNFIRYMKQRDDMLSKKNEELLTEVTQRFFLAAEKEQLDRDIVNKAIADVKRIFAKNPKKRDKRCFID